MEQHNPQRRIVEVAGSTTAECVVVWCCCPCGIANLILFAVYRIPAGICRRVIRSRRGRRKTAKDRVVVKESVCEGLSVMGKGGSGGNGDIVMLHDLLKMKVGYGDEGAAEEDRLRKFYGSGFWRSPSRIF